MSQPRQIAVHQITPGTFVRLRRQALGLGLQDVALMLDTAPAVSTQRRVEWLAAIEADLMPISLRTAIALHDAIRLDLRLLSYWMEVAEGATPSLFDALHMPPPDLGTIATVWMGMDVAGQPEPRS